MPPVPIDSSGAGRSAAILTPLLRALLLMSLLYALAAPLLYARPLIPLATVLVASLAFWGGLLLIGRGVVRGAALLVCGTLWLAVGAVALISGGTHSPAIVNYVVVVLLAGLALGGRAGLLAALLSVAASGGMLALELGGRLPPAQLLSTPGSALVVLTGLLLSTALLLALADTLVGAALARASAEVAERRRSEDALRAGEQRMAHALRAAQAGAWEWDRRTNAARWSPENYLVLGLPPGPPDVSYATWRDRVHPADIAAAEVAVTAAIAERRDLNIEFRVLWPDGRQRWINDIGRLVTDAAGEPRGMYGIQIDITNRKQIEAELRRSELYYRSLIEDLPAMVCRFQADGTLTFVNDLYCQAFQRTRADLEGSSFYDLIPPDDRATTREYLATLGPARPTASYEHPVVGPDGSQRWQRWTDRALLDEAGQVIEYQSLGEDVTDRKLAELDRERLISELEARNSELERFTYTVSHDLKSPLITIKGFAGYLERDAVSGNFDRLRTDIGRITAAADRMHQLLDELLDLSRVGRLVNPPERIAAADLVAEAAASASGRLAQRGVRLEIAADLPAIYGDRSRLREVFQNLLDNAAKFMGDQPQPQITIAARPAAGGPLITVADNGIGIEPRYHQRIFGLFERLDPQSEGTGIGLALARRIVEIHGGRIWVESEGGGQGTTFCLALPAPPEA